MDDLLSLRLLVVSPSDPLRDMWRQAAALASVPVEVIDAPTLAVALRLIADHDVDLLLIDGRFPDHERAPVVGAARAKQRAPFVAVLGDDKVRHWSCGADGVILTPGQIDHARELAERLLRTRLPSRVLLVDDSTSVLSVVRKVLGASRFPFDITETEAGTAALDLAQRRHFDIVFIDCNMPGLNGFETAAEIRRLRGEIEVVMMSADANVERRARADGASFIRKPFYPADVDAVLTPYYGLHALQKQPASLQSAAMRR